MNNKVYDSKTFTCICGTKAPYWDGGSCIPCYLPKYFDLDAKECKLCPDGQYF